MKDNIIKCAGALGPDSESEYNELDPEDVELEVFVNTTITVDEDGSWQFDDKKDTWAESETSDKNWYASYYYGILLAYPYQIRDYAMDMLEPIVTTDPGKYRIKCILTLSFEITEVYEKLDYSSSDEGDGPHEEIYTDDAQVEFVRQHSSVDQFECIEI